MRDRSTTALLCAVVALLLAGCSEAKSGTATPGATTSNTGTVPEPSTPPTSRSTDRHGAPPVKSPLDATQYLTQPCSAVSASLLQSLGLPSQGQPNTTGATGSRAPSCDWRAGQELIGVAFLKGNKNGLTDLYRSNASSPEAYWEETTVEDFPGVFHSTVDSRSRGRCNLSVGLNDALAMSVNEDGGLGTASCERAKKFAEAVIKTLKGQG